MTTPKPSDLICVAQIIGSHGVRGVLKIRSFLEDSEDLNSYGPLWDAMGQNSYAFEILSITPKCILARLKDIQTRNESDALKGLKLWAERSKFKSLNEDEYYERDLLGCSVLDTSGNQIGILTRISNYGAGDILEIKLKDGSSLLIPFQKDIVLKINANFEVPEKGSIVLDASYVEATQKSLSQDK